VLLGVACVAAIALLYRPLVLTSVTEEVGEARGVSAYRMEMCFLVVVGLATTMAVPVVGTLLIFTLMIGPAGAARALTAHPAYAMALSVAIALVTVWGAIAVSYATNWPIGFFVGAFGAAVYTAARCWQAWRDGRAVRVLRAA
jgi:zinc/manganese transport system permease protein